MKKTLLLASVCMFLISTAVVAQTGTLYPKANTDSLTLVKKISVDQLKLGQLQNEIEQKTRSMQNASAKAQQSADANSSAAANLTTNPDDRKLARQADNKAGDAKSDARYSRKEKRRLDDLNKEIADLKNKIADEQNKLNRYIPVSTPPAN